MEYLDFAIELARAGGDVLKQYMAGEKQVELKGRANLVTVADKESEALIIRRIRERNPARPAPAGRSGSSIRSMAQPTLLTSIRFSAFPSALNRPVKSCPAPSTTHGGMKCSVVLAAWDRFSMESGSRFPPSRNSGMDCLQPVFPTAFARKSLSP